MLIAVIGQKFNPQFNDRITGGTERSERDCVRLFSEVMNHEVDFITSCNSETLPWGNTLRVDYPAKYSMGFEASMYKKYPNKQRAQEVIDLLNKKPYDIILSTDENGCLWSKVVNGEIKDTTFLNYVFSGLAGSGGISIFNTINHYCRLFNSQNAYNLHLSKSSARDWKAFTLSNFKNLEIDEKIFNKLKHKKFGFIHDNVAPCVVWPETEVEPFYSDGDYLISIGRLVNWKRYETCIDIAGAMGRAIKLCHPAPKNLAEQEYLDYLQNYNPKVEKMFLFNLPHNQILEQLSFAAAHLICSVGESYGITAVEALTCGTPVLYVTRGESPNTTVEEATNDQLCVNHCEKFPRRKTAKYYTFLEKVGQEFNEFIAEVHGNPIELDYLAPLVMKNKWTTIFNNCKK